MSRVSLVVLLFLCAVRTGHAQVLQSPSDPPYLSEPLLEVPFYRVPEAMTYQDYVDANRRVSVGLLHAPLPGGMHFYANDDTTGWVLFGTAMAGFAMLIGGALALDDEGAGWEPSDFDTVDIGAQRFERTPVGESDVPGGSVREYQLTPLDHTRAHPDAGIFVVGGLIAVLGVYAFDILDGLDVIEDKRDLVRFKYGRELGGSERELR